MENALKNYQIKVGESAETPFLQRAGIYQDGTTPMFRDENGKLWAMSGHSHMGHIGMFKGTCLDDMKQVYEIGLNFCVGHKDYAFSGIRYPEGVKPRGSIWPFGLYVCPNTHRFFCFYHNETGWNGKGSANDAYGNCDIPHHDFDFRHVGLMHSDDEGKNWTFDRWVLTGEKPCFTEYYNPEAGLVRGQDKGVIALGSGDFSMFVEPNGEYIYIIYDIISGDTEKGVWKSCNAFIARTRKRTDGVMGDFVKYYNGSFCEAGNCGKETPIIVNAWHPRMVYLEKYGTYLMSSCIMRPDGVTPVILDEMEIRESKDMINWSEPVKAKKDGKIFGNHYAAMVADDDKGHPNVISGDDFSILTNHNGTDVSRFKTKIVKD